MADRDIILRLDRKGQIAPMGNCHNDCTDGTAFL